MSKILLSIAFLSFVITGYAQNNYVNTYAGFSGRAGLVNGALADAKFSSPFGMCIDKNRNIYVADNGNNCIRKISPNGSVSTYAGAKTAGYVDGTLAQARFKAPTGVCVDDSGNVYVSDFENHRIRKISKDGIVSTIAGNGKAGLADGQDTMAQFNYPRGICRDPQGNLYVGDSWNHRIRKITPSGLVSTYAGGGDTIGVQSVGHYKDAKDTAARFYTPCEVKIDALGNIYVADAYTHRIRKIDVNRNVSTYAGSGDIGQQAGGFADGNSGEAQFNVPTTVFIGSDGSLFVGDGINQRVRRIHNGVVSTFAGSGDSGFDDGPDSLATFNFPRAVIEDTSNRTFFVVDFNNHAIRSIGKLTSINNQLIKNISISPNPANNILNITLADNAAYSLSIISIEGKVIVQSYPNTGNKQQIDISQLPAGMYYLHAKSNDNVSIGKFVKQ